VETSSTLAQEPGILPGMKLYVITRGDLPPGPAAIQSCHAFMQFICEHVGIGRTWFEQSNTLSFLEARDEAHLKRLLQDAKELGIRCSSFQEPDLKMSMTSIALEPGPRSKKLVARLPPLLREK
jgi:hypothetical protein